MADGNTAFTGRKIFFIHPSAFTQNEIISELAQQEHEVYIVKDEDKLKRVLKKYPDSFVFASIDETLSSAKWEAWIRSVMGDEATKEVKIGVLSNTSNEESRKLYLNTLNVECGFIPVKLEKPRVIKTLSDILIAGDARGRRKYIRADTRGETMTTINVPNNGAFVTGEIRDISVVGLSCVFAQDPELEKNSLLHDIQIKLQSTLLKAEGIVFGSRMDETDKVYVLVFSQKIDPAVKTKIRTYIQKNLQSKMDAELK
ncbi:MAG: PilZ domain-containing protein [Treponema sp.]|nr:PilZ domain-containing protein [Treponema sp.]